MSSPHSVVEYVEVDGVAGLTPGDNSNCTSVPILGSLITASPLRTTTNGNVTLSVMRPPGCWRLTVVSDLFVADMTASRPDHFGRFVQNDLEYIRFVYCSVEAHDYQRPNPYADDRKIRYHFDADVLKLSVHLRKQ